MIGHRVIKSSDVPSRGNIFLMKIFPKMSSSLRLHSKFLDNSVFQNLPLSLHPSCIKGVIAFCFQEKHGRFGHFAIWHGLWTVINHDDFCFYYFYAQELNYLHNLNLKIQQQLFVASNFKQLTWLIKFLNIWVSWPPWRSKYLLGSWIFKWFQFVPLCFDGEWSISIKFSSPLSPLVNMSLTTSTSTHALQRIWK